MTVLIGQWLKKEISVMWWCVFLSDPGIPGIACARANEKNVSYGLEYDFMHFAAADSLNKDSWWAQSLICTMKFLFFFVGPVGGQSWCSQGRERETGSCVTRQRWRNILGARGNCSDQTLVGSGHSRPLCDKRPKSPIKQKKLFQEKNLQMWEEKVLSGQQLFHTVVTNIRLPPAFEKQWFWFQSWLKIGENKRWCCWCEEDFFKRRRRVRRSCTTSSRTCCREQKSSLQKRRKGDFFGIVLFWLTCLRVCGWRQSIIQIKLKQT